MVAIVAISELTFSRVTTRPLNSPTAPPNRMPAQRPQGDAAGLVGDVHRDDAAEGERGADREVDLGGDQQHGHAGRDDQHQRALPQDGDEIFDGVELRRADRDGDAEQRRGWPDRTIWLLPASLPNCRARGRGSGDDRS